MQILYFIAGVSILLLAMKQLEAALASLGEGQLRKGLAQFTSTPVHGILLGTITTAILQSSSIVGLMTMAFVGAGVLTLRSAIGVILGSNLGTTITGWLVAWVGFKVDLEEFYIILLGIGATLSVITKESSKKSEAGRLFLAFGLLLLSLSLMKDSVDFIIELVDVSRLQAFPLFGFFLFGLLLTAIIQSSSATTMITLAAMSSGILQLDNASAVVIGANLGTTSTLILGAISGPVIKRQIALVHLLFNVTVSLLAFFSLPWLLRLIKEVYLVQDPLFSLVALYTTINLAGIVLFLPILDPFRRLVERLLPLPQKQELVITQVSTLVPAAAFTALEQDIRLLLVRSVLLNAWRLGILTDRLASRKLLLAETAQITYAELKGNENQLSDYILELQGSALSPLQVTRTQQLLVCIRDCLYSTKAVKDIEADLLRFRHENGPPVHAFIDKLLSNIEHLYTSALALLEESGEVSEDTFRHMLEEVRVSYSESNSSIYQLINKKLFLHDRASSALNINRELLLAEHSLINALEHCLLPRETSHTVSELLSLRT